MTKNVLIAFICLLVTQSVLAGIDIHHISRDQNNTDIVEHYVDAHTNISPCFYDNTSLTSNSIDSSTPHAVTSIDISVDDLSHHYCHGHTVFFVFPAIISLQISMTGSSNSFSYLLNLYAINLSPNKRPPITV